MDNALNALTQNIVYGNMEVVINLLMAMLLGIIIARVYISTHRGLSYSQSMIFTLIMMSIIVAGVMMVIGNSLARAFGVLGALSIIRFRTVIKDTKDIAYVFFALAVGMASGTGSYFIALVLCGMVSVLMLVLTKVNFGSINKHDYILKFNYRTSEGGESDYMELFSRHLRKYMPISLNPLDKPDIIEMMYNVQFRKESNLKDFISRLSRISGIEHVELISSKQDIDY